MLDQFLGHHRLKPAEVDDRVEITVETIEIAGHGIEAAQFLVHVEANGAVLEFLGKMPAPHVGRFRIGVFEELIIILEIQLAGGRAQGLKAFAIGEIEAERLFVEEALVTGLIFLLDRLQEAVSQLMRSEEHTSELQSLMRISYAVLCLEKNTTKQHKLIT